MPNAASHIVTGNPAWYSVPPELARKVAIAVLKLATAVASVALASPCSTVTVCVPCAIVEKIEVKKEMKIAGNGLINLRCYTPKQPNSSTCY